MKKILNFFSVVIILFVVLFANNVMAARPDAAITLSCDPGTYWDGSICAICSEQYYCEGFESVVNPKKNYGRIKCPNGYTDGGVGLTSIKGCVLQTTPGKYIANINDSQETKCPAGYYCPVALINYGDTGEIIQCTGATYSDVAAAICTDCPGGYVANLDPGKTAIDQCQIQTTVIIDNPVPTDPGTYIATAYSDVLTICPAGYYCPAALINYGDTGEIIQCPTGYDDGVEGDSDISDCQIQTTDGTYIATANTDVLATCTAGHYCPAALVNYGTVNLPTECTVGSYSGNAASVCIACQDGTTTTDAGQSSCNATCSNNNDYDSSWNVAGWSDNVVTNLCSVSGCIGGYYVAIDSCEAVGIDYWSAPGLIFRTACTVGLTTIGFGPGADEASDCGKVFNIGSNKVHLRSEKKTTPSLYIQLDGSVYYGSMDTAPKGSVKASYNGNDYFIYDDSM